ncbi:MAG: type IV pilus modification protein PilV, partial [Nitrococcus sp.]|nr:type IV pilus modification protein PilV [Nitrococcus sp.]
SQATIMAYDILDRMRANRAQAQAGDYNKYNDTTSDPTIDTTIDDASDLPSITSSSTQADIDLNQWGNNVLALPGASATVRVNSDNTVSVSISWDDSRADRADDRSGTAVTNATQFQFQTEF